jgi:hypothetical protein
MSIVDSDDEAVVVVIVMQMMKVVVEVVRCLKMEMLMMAQAVDLIKSTTIHSEQDPFYLLP